MSVCRHRQTWQLNPESLHGQLVRVGSLNNRFWVAARAEHWKIQIMGWRVLNALTKTLDNQVAFTFVNDYVLIVDHASVANNLFFLCLNARMDLCWTYADEL